MKLFKCNERGSRGEGKGREGKGRGGEGEGRGREGQVCSMRFRNTWDTPTPWANSMIKFCSSIHILLGHEL